MGERPGGLRLGDGPLAGVAYWLIHASVDWLWQMAGVSIPVLLFLAAGVAACRCPSRCSVAPLEPVAQDTTDYADAAAGHLRRRPGSAWPEHTAMTQASRRSAGESSARGDREGQFETLLSIRRAEKYLSKQSRRRRKEARRRGNAERLQPPGVLSPVFRLLLLTLSLIVIVSAGLPYLSLQIQDSALGIAKTDGIRAAARAEAARWLQPADPGPFVTQAGHLLERRFGSRRVRRASDRAGAVLDNLALSIGSYENAIANDPADWTLHYRAGVATLNLLYADCTRPAGTRPGLRHARPVHTRAQGLVRTVRPAMALPEPGAAAGSLAKTAETRQIAEHYRRLSHDELRQQAIDYLEAAKERNPLASEVTEALKVVEELR